MEQEVAAAKERLEKDIQTQQENICDTTRRFCLVITHEQCRDFAQMHRTYVQKLLQKRYSNITTLYITVNSQKMVL
jgi:hypothetical protein